MPDPKSCGAVSRTGIIALAIFTTTGLVPGPRLTVFVPRALGPPRIATGAGNDDVNGGKTLTGEPGGDVPTGSTSASVVGRLDGKDTLCGQNGSDGSDGLGSGRGVDTLTGTPQQTGPSLSPWPNPPRPLPI